MTKSTNNTDNDNSGSCSTIQRACKQEKWFEIQDELFADNVRSIDPPNSPYFGYAEGKAPVRKKGEEFVKRIEAVHRSLYN